MSVDVEKPRSRRAMLAGIGAGVAAVVATVAGKPTGARGANGDPVLLGLVNDELAPTRIAQGAANAVALDVVSVLGGEAGHAITASSTNGIGVYAGSETNSALRGQSTYAAGVHGSSGGSTDAAIVGFSSSHFAAVAGYLDAAPTLPPPDGTAVYGNSQPVPTGVAVWGQAAVTPTSSSAGVYGEGDVGVFGAGVGGYGAIGGAYADGVGLYGSASNSLIPGVYGGAGVIGQADAGGTAIVGFTGLSELLPTKNCGVYGRADTGGVNGRGMVGSSNAGQGILGQTVTGIAIRAYCGNNTGVALNVTGKATFDRSGKLTIGATATTVTKTGIGLTAASFILATLQTNVTGLFVQSVVTNVAGSSFTIRLNKAPGVTVSVAWLAVS